MRVCVCVWLCEGLCDCVPDMTWLALCEALPACVAVNDADCVADEDVTWERDWLTEGDDVWLALCVTLLLRVVLLVAERLPVSD